MNTASKYFEAASDVATPGSEMQYLVRVILTFQDILPLEVGDVFPNPSSLKARESSLMRG